MRHFAIVQRKDEYSKNIADQIRRGLLQGGMMESSLTPDLVLAVGGDGTFLSAVHQYLDRLDQIQLIGVHTGTLGFMTDYCADEIDQLLDDVLYHTARIDAQKLLEIIVDANPEKRYFAVNEMRIENPIKTQLMEITIDDVLFETFRGTGVCLSTQMGSTAYNRSIRGAVIQHGLPLLELSEIAGIHHREYQSLGSSIILAPKTRVRFDSESFEGATLCYDHCFVPLHSARQIECFNSEKAVRIARYRPYHYLSRLKNLF